MGDEILIQPAQFEDQGKVGAFLLSALGGALTQENAKAVAAGLPGVNIEDELMAADDFYFSSVELMDCCIVARAGGRLAGVACVNPFTSTLHFIAVAADCRRKGIGQKLLEAAKAVLKKRGCDHVKIEYPAHADFAGADEFFGACGMPEASSPKKIRACQIAPRKEPAEADDCDEDEDD